MKTILVPLMFLLTLQIEPSNAFEPSNPCYDILDELHGPIVSGVTILLFIYCIISFILSFKIKQKIRKGDAEKEPNKKLIAKYNTRKWISFILLLILLAMHIPTHVIIPVYDPLSKECKGVGYHEDKCFTLFDTKLCLRK